MRIQAIKRDRTTYYLANTSDAILSYNPHRVRPFVIWFGAVGTTSVLVWADSFDDALEIAAEYVKERGWIGYFMPDLDMEQYYREACERNGVEWEDFRSHGVIDADSEQVLRDAEEDLTYTESGWIPSDEWGGTEAARELATLASKAVAFERMFDDWCDRERCAECDRALPRDETLWVATYGDPPFKGRRYKFCSDDCLKEWSES